MATPLLLVYVWGPGVSVQEMSSQDKEALSLD